METNDHADEWYSQKEELIALKSIYSGEGECELIRASKDTIDFDELLDKEEHPFSVWPLVLKIHIPVQTSTSCHFNLCVVFQLDKLYPRAPPQIKLKSDQLTETSVSLLEHSATSFAATLQPEPCLFNILEWLKDSVSDITETDINIQPLSESTTNICQMKETTNPLSSASVACASNLSCSKVNPCMGDSQCCTTSLLHKETPSKGQIKLPETTPLNKTGSAQQGLLQVSRKDSKAQQMQLLCIAKLDHMRNETKYFKILDSWAKELKLSGKVLNAGVHSIYIVLVGTNDNLGEFLRRWKTQNVDVDSRGRSCKEKLIKVLCQEVLKPSSNRLSDRSCGLEMIHCSKGDLLEHINDDGNVKRALQKFV